MELVSSSAFVEGAASIPRSLKTIGAYFWIALTKNYDYIAIEVVHEVPRSNRCTPGTLLWLAHRLR
jgi:hypothetical protein